MMMMVRKSKGLGERHQKILDFIASYQREHKHPPSIREIGEYCDISSTSVVNYYLDQLEKAGLLERDRKISRGMRLVGNTPLGDMLRVPVLGVIQAGEPIPVPASDFSLFDADESVEVATSLMPAKEKGKDLFALQVQGDSMIDAMINDGDIVILKPAQDARNGDMVAVWLNDKNETTLKYYFKEKDGYRLQPANPQFKPIMIKKTEPLEIKGKVVMVIRKVDRYN
ncbi:MAG: transcriptional repressor LexA [Anaerolineales bacterium]|jgi:repressor LexA|nr:repressor LexA [Anaerolineales bacterium]MBX3037111.1 transcriptional repressor LexA [Anaerolineales bacterium]HCK67063.1 repressor LexA [Anaerolineae bacterium]HCR70902.1 repressor LexA [Anaerolineae bacterium]HRJ74532.1 transcriptional repressor LexA [Anaerolineales bacterium]